MILEATTSGLQVPEARPSILKEGGLTVWGRWPGRQNYGEQLNAYRGESSLSSSPGELEATVSKAILTVWSVKEVLLFSNQIVFLIIESDLSDHLSRLSEALRRPESSRQRRAVDLRV